MTSTSIAMMVSQARIQFATGPAHISGVPSMNRISPVNTARSPGTCTSTSPPVCAGPTSINRTALSPTFMSITPEKVLVGVRSSTFSKSNGANTSAKYAPAGPSFAPAALNMARVAGGTSAISRALASLAMISACGQHPLPWQWSPFACVLTMVPILPAPIPVASSIAVSMSRVSAMSNSVSTSSDASPSRISPAFDQPQPPSGCSQA